MTGNPLCTPDANALAMRVARALMAREGTGAAWGLELEAAGPGYARVAMRLTPVMLNGHQTAHGGMIFGLGDSAFAYACNSYNETSVAQHCSIAFLSPGHVGERLFAEAREVTRVGRTGSYDIIIFGEDGRVIGHMHGLSRTIGGAVIEEESNNG